MGFTKMTSLNWSILLLSIFSNYIVCADVEPSTDHVSPEAASQQFFEIIRNTASSKDVEIPFPIAIIDPFKLNSLELNVPGAMFGLNLSISDGSISGLSRFRLLELNISSVAPIITFDVLFPTLKFHSEHYKLDGHVYYAIPIKGGGVAHLEVHNLRLWGTMHMKQSATSNSILFDKLENADFNMEKIVLLTEFDHNIDHIINAMVEDLLASYLNRFSKYLTATYSDILIQYINDILLMYERH